MTRTWMPPFHLPMTDSGLEMPPDHMVSQMRSILDLSSPVIISSTLELLW